MQIKPSEDTLWAWCKRRYRWWRMRHTPGRWVCKYGCVFEGTLANHLRRFH